MQKNFVYFLTEKPGANFRSDFDPQLTPQQMLEMGVFGGKYMTDCKLEFPKSWFEKAKLCHERHDPSLNFFKVNASLSLAYWRAKGWINSDDPRGWFQWYCRYFQGRRNFLEDDRQIKRWRAMKRHIGLIARSCERGDLSCHVVARQALLHWAYDSRLI